MIGALLLGEGYEVSAAVDGRDGLAKARELTPELILSDYEMPELDGPGFCQALKADPRAPADPGHHAHDPRRVGAQGRRARRRGGRLHREAQAARPRSRSCSPGSAPSSGSPTSATSWPSATRQLEAAKAKLDLELKLARKVQRGLMPRAPKPRGVLRMAVRYHPANELGGDVYDFVPARRATGWASSWPTSRGTGSTRPCSRGWSRRSPPR